MVLSRRPGEKRAYFLSRRYCNQDCYKAGRSAAAEERRIGQDIGGGAHFERADILHAAHRAAPQVPMSILADVVDRVEPLIAANTRHRLMAVVAAKFRANSE
jgi:hypothetical protein